MTIALKPTWTTVILSTEQSIGTN